MTNPGPGVIYTETLIHAAPQQFVADAPYQLVIVTLDSGRRLTARMIGDRVQIGDAVDFAEDRGGIPFFRKH
ncbi:MAG TPA: OB-fold domain-containing protein [Bryobacteraceae bacterium]|nr:OB-fold domain-containing protein [Bryobacteraceae bacterium]